MAATIIFALLVSCNSENVKESQENGEGKLEIPTLLDEPSMVPVNITTGNYQDEIKRIEIDVPSNETAHQRALSITFFHPVHSIKLSTRVRMTKANPGIVRATIVRGDKNEVIEGRIPSVPAKVNFSDSSTIDTSFVTTQNLMPNAKIGESRIAFNSPNTNYTRITSVIHHPNFPTSVGSNSRFLEEINAFIDSTHFYTARVYSALTNDTFLAVQYLKQDLPVKGTAKVEWTESTGEKFIGTASYSR